MNGAPILTQTEKSINLLQFETNTLCNANCKFCMHNKMKRHGDMPFWKTLDLLYNLAPHAQSICPFGMQEPLLDRHFSQILANCKLYNPNASTIVYSNMSVYPEEHWRRILNAGLLDELVISFYGVDEATYWDLQPPLQYELTRANIKRLMRYKHRLNWNKPKVKLDFLVMPETMPLAKQFYDEWKPIVDEFAVVALDNWCGSIPVDFKLLERVLPRKPYPRVPCHRLWSTLMIHYTGNVVLCCLDYDDSVVLGNVFKDGWDVWFNNPKLRV